MTKGSNAVLTLVFILGAGLLPIALFFLQPPAVRELPPVGALPFHPLLPQEQAAQVIAGLLVKPTYMLVSLAIIVALHDQHSADLAALQAGQIAFLVGETFCAINFYFYRHESVLSEYVHSYGMAVAFGLTVFALLEGLDARVLKLSSSSGACAALPLCGKCTRHQDEGCKLRSLSRVLVPVLAGLLFIPLLSPLQPDAYAVSLFGFPYSYTRWNVYEVYERRILPLLGLVAFAIAFFSLLRKGTTPLPVPAKIFTAAGVGALGFSFLRLGLNAIFASDLVWFEVWEETTELLYIGLVAFTLWEFRRTLLPRLGSIASQLQL